LNDLIFITNDDEKRWRWSMKAKMIAFSLLWVAFSLPLAACQGIQIQQVSPALTASGTISANITRVAPEVGGKILNIRVSKGDTVKAGDVLFTLDSQLLQAQHDQAAAAVQVAQAAVDGAQKKLANAQAQYNLAVQSAQMQNSQSRTNAWQANQPTQFSEPNWYFQKTEQITALQTEIDNAQTALASEQANLKDELQKASNEDFVAAEKRLAVAQAAYQDASKTLDQARLQKTAPPW
jgi:HlyD family secretion protein